MTNLLIIGASGVLGSAAANHFLENTDKFDKIQEKSYMCEKLCLTEK